MSFAAQSGSDPRLAQLSQLATSSRKALKRIIPAVAILIGAEVVHQLATGKQGAIPLALIGLGTCIALAAWRQRGIGLPLMPMIVLQHLVVYGLPLVIAQASVTSYPQDYVVKAGIELLVFLCTLAAAWRLGIGLFKPAPAISYALNDFQGRSSKKLRAIGFFLILSTFAYQVADRLELLEGLISMLPSGSYSILWALVSAAGTCGFFILSLLLGSGGLNPGQKAGFWFILGANCYIAASGFLLSAAIIVVFSVIIGLFWSTGRIPWKYTILVLAVFSYLNVGKVTMRERYWVSGGADQTPNFSLMEMPAHYAEWIQASFDDLTRIKVAPDSAAARLSPQPENGQSLLERVNNLQNLLFAINAIDGHHIEPLYGATYAIVPKLLIPRFLWPDKPGTHEGQAMLNVHFGRQDLLSTTTTYVAWGLLPEAYGNFGPYAGSIFLGFVMGLVFAWIEAKTANKLVISLEGFIAFTLFLAMANSFELVASVLVTSIEQAIIPIVFATMPFVRRTVHPALPGRT